MASEDDRPDVAPDGEAAPVGDAPPVELPSQSASAGAPAPAEMPDLEDAALPDSTSAIDMLGDVDLDVKIELGRCRMLVEDVLSLSPGSVVELDKLAGDPVDVFVNDRLVARGEVLVVNDNFCVRINEILSGDE